MKKPFTSVTVMHFAPMYSAAITVLAMTDTTVMALTALTLTSAVRTNSFQISPTSTTASTTARHRPPALTLPGFTNVTAPTGTTATGLCASMAMSAVTGQSAVLALTLSELRSKTATLAKTTVTKTPHVLTSTAHITAHVLMAIEATGLSVRRLTSAAREPTIVTLTLGARTLTVKQYILCSLPEL